MDRCGRALTVVVTSGYSYRAQKYSTGSAVVGIPFPDVSTKPQPVVNLDERALNIFTDGSSYSGPRRGGIGFRIVVVNDEGHEVAYDEQPAGYQGATNQQMELAACIAALAHVAGRYSQVDPSDYKKVVIYTDSMYVANGFEAAKFNWHSNGWMTRDGNPVENAKLWKQLLNASLKVSRPVYIEWAKGHSASNPHNKAVDKLAKGSAKGVLRPPVSIARVRRKRTDKSTELGSVKAEGQRISIRIITDELLPLQHMYKYKYEVISKGSPYRGNVDTIYSGADIMLSAGHEYYVRLNSDSKQPRIERVLRELETTRASKRERYAP
jgi:ribonuclease HI